MSDMGTVFEVTDAMGIDRESVSVALEKAGTGNVQILPGNIVDIVLPVSILIEEWQEILRTSLESFGYITNHEQY
jgi:hypothetical protein